MPLKCIIISHGEHLIPELNSSLRMIDILASGDTHALELEAHIHNAHTFYSFELDQVINDLTINKISSKIEKSAWYKFLMLTKKWYKEIISIYQKKVFYGCTSVQLDHTLTGSRSNKRKVFTTQTNKPSQCKSRIFLVYKLAKIPLNTCDHSVLHANTI